MTELVHTGSSRQVNGHFFAQSPLAEGVKRAKSITRVLFGTDVSTVNADDVLEALAGDRRLFTIPADEMYGTTVLKLTVSHGVTKNTSASSQAVKTFLPLILLRCCKIVGGNAWSLSERPDCRRA